MCYFLLSRSLSNQPSVIPFVDLRENITQREGQGEHVEIPFLTHNFVEAVISIPWKNIGGNSGSRLLVLDSGFGIIMILEKYNLHGYVCTDI